MVALLYGIFIFGMNYKLYTSMSILSIRNVHKAYHNHVALNDVSLEVKKGSIFGLLGPNGAGKTSLIRIITSITKADRGEVLIDGEPLNLLHPHQIGYMPEERGLYKKMKVGEQLLYLAQLKGMPKKEATANIISWCKRLDMDQWYDKKIEELSKGMSQKVQFVATVAHNPKLLILDEPFSGLDPLNADILKEEIYKLNKTGVSIIFSTHRMEQVEEICDDVVLVNKGDILLNDSIKNIRQNFKENKFSLHSNSELSDLTSNDKFEIIKVEEGKITFKISQNGNSNQVLSELISKNININGFNEILPNLTEIFIRLVKEDNNN
jgi:ABC-2 type transport system ATP-binding protein